jgi:hypothetical protein
MESCVELHRHSFMEFRTRCLFLTDETFFKMNDRSSVGAVELFLVNLNDNGISERLVSGG